MVRGGDKCEHGDLVLPPSDLEFVKTFLFTYQAFTTPGKLLRKLIERYNVVRPEGMPLKEFGVMRQTIQARVINALRLWVDFCVDFKGKWRGYYCSGRGDCKALSHCR